MHRLAGVLVTALLVGVAWSPAGADVEVVLTNGVTLEANSIERVDGLYAITTDAGVLTLPLELVREIRLFELPPGEEPGTAAVEEEPSEIEVVALDAATGVGGPDHVVGDPASPPAWLQLAAFPADPAAFPRPTVDPRWEPDDSYGEATDATQFDPAAWARSREHGWEPGDDYEPGGLPRFGLADWPRPPVDTRWSPGDRWRTRLFSSDE